MIVSGATVPAERFRGTALLDAIIDGDLLQGALEFAASAAVTARPLPRVREIAIAYPNADALFQFARNTVRALSRGFPAPLKCIDAVAASATVPFEEGLRLERELFIQLAQSPESHALRHAFFAQRAAAKIPDLPSGTTPRTINSAAVIGGGTMGTGIAICLLDAGWPVSLVEAGQPALDKGMETIRSHYARAVERGRLPGGEAERRLGMLKPTLAYEDLAGADLVIEAVFEDMDVKKQVFQRLDAVAKPAAILASNTSTLDLNKIAAFTARPQDIVGMHFFSPANVMKLLEVVRGARTGNDVLVTVMGVAKKMGKTAVVSGVCDGFIGNRMIEQYLRQAFFLLEEGASPSQVDRALEKFGMAMGPFRMSDLAGNDV
ncbi:MAG TPA: 3-hydroxyacyl-CoA dehydrogenase family protein, partial [Solirubrobacterales bacterium]|nr:3-hydroxyacyl-CoA dehydrogenase family protein [Solirubrobacterales bacterium]